MRTRVWVQIGNGGIQLRISNKREFRRLVTKIHRKKTENHTRLLSYNLSQLFRGD